MLVLGGHAHRHRPGLPTLIVVAVVVLSAPSAWCNNDDRVFFPPQPPSRVLLFLPLLWLLLSSSLLLLLLWMLFPLEAKAPITVVILRAIATYPAPPNKKSGCHWLLAHATMAMV